MVWKLRLLGEVLALCCYFAHQIVGMPASVDLPVVYPGGMRLAPPTERNGLPSCVKSPSSTFCENVTNYPAERIRRLLNYSPKEFSDLFGAKGVNSRRTISHDDVSAEPICRTRSNIVFPQSAKNDQNKWRYVINDVDYVQSVTTEQCVKDGSDCAYVQDSLPSGYKSFCKQRFSYKSLVAMDPDQLSAVTDSFRFPSCCSCYVKVPSIHERMNGHKRNMSPATGRRRK